MHFSSLFCFPPFHTVSLLTEYSNFVGKNFTSFFCSLTHDVAIYVVFDGDHGVILLSWSCSSCSVSVSTENLFVVGDHCYC